MRDAFNASTNNPSSASVMIVISQVLTPIYSVVLITPFMTIQQVLQQIGKPA